jgi:hypothetical protein
MIVKAIDDINLKIIDDEERRTGFVFWPNSVRRDIPFHFTPPAQVRIHPYQPYTGRWMDQMVKLGIPL